VSRAAAGEANGRGAVPLVEVTRGPAVESRHAGHVVVVDADDRLIFAAGQPERLTFPRSSLKPLQALPTHARGAASHFGLTGPEIAVMAASHAAEPFHLEAVRGILAKIDARESDLFCGPHSPGNAAAAAALVRGGEEPRPIHNNCSGKHAGMLALARLLGAPLSGYQEPDHPAQVEIRSTLLEVCGVDTSRLGWGTDGCGVPTYLTPLRALALGFARLSAPERLAGSLSAGARTITDAMRAHPPLVSSTGAFCAELMTAAGGAVIAKGGAEGVYAFGLPERGWGVAIKMEDGNARGMPAVVLALLKAMGALDPGALDRLAAFRQPIVRNTRAAPVGELRCSLDFRGSF
jgi:L-asparaginase II